MHSLPLAEAVAYLQKEGVTDPHVGIILGTGLGNLAQEIHVEKAYDYGDIPGFPISTVEHHHGRLLYGTLSGKRVLAMQGRFHFYEGYTMQQITFPIRVMKLLGIRWLLISNAAGSLNPTMPKGSLMLLNDHINLQSGNPLFGPNDDSLGPRFPDMSQPYHPHLNRVLLEAARQLHLTLHQGVYVAVNGPNLETRAEYRFLRIIGADAVGMSTVPEVIVANHMNLPVAAVSVLTDECDPDHLQPVNIEEIIATAAEAEPKLTALFTRALTLLE
ncbi:MAG: purine-nucleoside phosphorylase [Chitinophagales bacterium]|nr:purine-nucleoside phosphorylase [Chitinophagales bacterium]MDW8428119.1 purine-nucleoside phosphorylase [Chitinophagales bacterium]